ncbi:MAG: DUF2905 domain-containing protein [Ardenticatenaceae bacterium]|nr:DUF2905 domain-containing protein [Ardenticatenaceae bacterium]
MTEIGRILMIIGIVITIVGAALWFAGRYLPWLGHLPGDIRYESENMRVYLPLATMLLVSIIGTIILNIIVRLFNR